MQVLVLNNVPEKTKGYASRYFLEISPSIFVGHVNKKVSTHLWDYIRGNLGKMGNAIFLVTTNNAQGYDVLVSNADSRKEIIDLDGIKLILTKKIIDNTNDIKYKKTGWSKASRYKRN